MRSKGKIRAVDDYPGKTFYGRAGMDSIEEKPGAHERLRPLTVFLVVLFIISAIILLGVVNLKIVRDYFEEESLFWVLRSLIGVMIVCLVLYLVFLERAHSRRVSEQLRKIEEVNRRLHLLLDAGKEIGSTLELQQILKDLLDHSLWVTKACAGAVYLHDRASSSLKLALTQGVDEKKLVFRELPVGKGLVGEAALEKEIAVIDDASTLDRRDNVFFGAFEPGSMLVVPLVARDKFLGMLITANREPHSYTSEEERLVTGLAELASLPIANSELYRIARKSLDIAARQRNFTESVLEQMVAGVITCDSEGRIAVFNRMAQRLTGFSFEEKHQAALSEEQDLGVNPLGPVEKSMLEAMKDPKRVIEAEAVLKRKDGSLLPVEYRAYAVTDNSHVLGATAVFMEARSGRMRGVEDEEVECSLILRTLGARIDMIYVNPLKGVIERIEEMDQDSLGGCKQEIMEILQAGSETLRSLLGDLEQYVEATHEKDWETEEEVDVGETLRHALHSVENKWGLGGVDVQFETCDAPRFVGNERMVRTAIEKVLENAVILSATGGRKVRVTARAEGGDFLCVEIRDTGGGIPEDSREFVFVPFYSTLEGHVGLGLPTARKILTHIGGRLDFSNVPGGALFSLLFPLGKDRVAGDDIPPVSG